MVMLYREEKIIENGGSFNENDERRANSSPKSRDDYFARNYGS